MSIWQRIIALQKIPAFASLDAGRLALIAAVCRERSHLAGETVINAGQRPGRLLLAIRGDLLTPEGRRLPVPFGVDALLFEREIESSGVVAGPDGVDCLTIGRSHLFTILAECPELALGLLEGRRK